MVVLTAMGHWLVYPDTGNPVRPDDTKIFKDLRHAGLSSSVIRAAWPVWWSDELSSSPSGRTELRFTLARKLGLSPKSLLGERIEFVWKNKARFKYLSVQDDFQQSALTSFGVSLARLLLRASPRGDSIAGIDAQQLREHILSAREFVDLQGLLVVCWAVGIPVIHLRVFPLPTKSMHAMVVEVEGRHAILLGRDANYPAPIAFTLAHELAHIILKHLDGVAALIDLEDPASANAKDDQEVEADAYALELLTGSGQPEITTNIENFSALALAEAVLEAAPIYKIEPGTLALCLAYRRQLWPTAMASLHNIYSSSKPVWNEVNAIAINELDWQELNDESAEYLSRVMTGKDE